MPAPCVVFDLDEVLANLRAPTHEAMVRRYGRFPHWKLWDTYDYVTRVSGMSLEQYLQMIVEERLLESMPPEDGAWSAVQAVRDMGFRTAVVTSRGYHPNAEQVTCEWLHRHDLEMDDVVIVANHDKLAAIRSLGDVVAYIDDRPKTLRDLQEAGFGGVLCLNVMPWGEYDYNSFDHWVRGVRWFPEELEDALKKAA